MRPHKMWGLNWDTNCLVLRLYSALRKFLNKMKTFLTISKNIFIHEIGAWSSNSYCLIPSIKFCWKLAIFASDDLNSEDIGILSILQIISKENMVERMTKALWCRLDIKYTTVSTFHKVFIRVFIRVKFTNCPRTLWGHCIYLKAIS